MNSAIPLSTGMSGCRQPRAEIILRGMYTACWLAQKQWPNWGIFDNSLQILYFPIVLAGAVG